jgi:hypothetical protein
LSIYNALRNLFRANIVVSIILALILLATVVIIYIKKIKVFEGEDRKIMLFGSTFFVGALLIFLGLGNITSRYSYLASLGLIIIFVYFIKKLYLFLEKSGREIALLVIAILILVYSTFQVIQVQQGYFDWSGAGQKVKLFFVSLDSVYTNYWSRDEVEFHFVNVPIKSGSAWVFPVGIEDATWFAFKNDKAKVFIHPTVDEALQSAGLDYNKRVFQFNDDGSVREIDKYTKSAN